MQGILVPAGTPGAVIDLLHGEILKVMGAARREGANGGARVRASREYAGRICRRDRSRSSGYALRGRGSRPAA